MKPNCEIYIRYMNGEYDSIKVTVPIIDGNADLTKLAPRFRGQGYVILSHVLLINDTEKDN